MLSFLLSLADESDHDKIVYIYEHFHTDMIRMARRRLYLANATDCYHRAEDVVQDAYVKLITYIHAIDFSVSERELRSYVLSTVANAAINELKGTQSCDSIDEYINISSRDNFVDDLLIHERFEEVRAAIERLREIYRMALDYHFCKGYSVKQMSEMFDLPEKTIYTRISRAQQMLKELLEKEDRI